MAAGSILSSIFIIGGNCFVPTFHFTAGNQAESGADKEVRPDSSSPVASQCFFSSAKDDLSTSPPNEDHQDVVKQSLDGDGSKNCSRIEEDGIQQYPVVRLEKQVQSSCSTLLTRDFDTKGAQACRSSGDRTQGAFQESPKFDRKQLHGQLTKRSNDPSQVHLKRYLGEASDEVQGKGRNYFKDLNSYNMSPECKYKFIYLTEETVRKVNLNGMNPISRGGNGTVFSDGIFAIKWTKYNPESLNIVHKLDHFNLMELQGVVLLGSGVKCLHIMPLMTCDLSDALHPIGTLKKLAEQNDEETWATNDSNTRYVLREIAKGLSYLAGQNIEHGDIKEKNILIKKTCQCVDVLNCICSEASKYLVKISDYDYTCQSESYCAPVDFQHCGNYSWFEYPGGTISYRAPEKCIKGLCGPSSDIYSLGVLMRNMCLERSTNEAKCNASILARQPGDCGLTSKSECSYNQIMLTKLIDAARQCSRLGFFASLVRDCTEINPCNRLTARELLKKLA